MIGMVGLAIDTGQIYVTKQLEQATADAAAQAGAMDLFNGSNQAIATAMAYVQNAGFVNIGASNQVNVSYQNCATLVWCNNGKVPLSNNNPNLIEVQITKTVNTTLLRVLGETLSTVTSTAFAGVTRITSAIPMIIATHPTFCGALSLTGGSPITISGGIQRAIEVNSNCATAFSSAGSVDLSAAGPSGSGGDLAVVGGPGSQPGGLGFGSTGHYVPQASTIEDPFPDQMPPLNAPPVPAQAAPTVALSNGVSGCPPNPLSPCRLYSPGLYAGGIDIRNQTAVFKPGIYYIASGGFTGDFNGGCAMATGFTDTSTGTNTGWTGNMLVYNTLGRFATVNNFGNCTLVGAPSNDIQYHGILFFQDPSASASHIFAGTGTMSLTGILYMSNPAAVAGSQYQTLTFSGGRVTIINGGIIANVLSLNGATITMTAPNPIQVPNVRQAALVQ